MARYRQWSGQKAVVRDHEEARQKCNVDLVYTTASLYRYDHVQIVVLDRRC